MTEAVVFLCTETPHCCSMQTKAHHPLPSQQCKLRNLTFPVSGIHSKFPSSAVLSTEPVISAQLIRGRGVSWPSLHVTMYYTAALVIVLLNFTVPASPSFLQDQSRFVIFVSFLLFFFFSPPLTFICFLGNVSDKKKKCKHDSMRLLV